MRGTVSRAELRRVRAATYHQVCWPDTPLVVRFEDDALPVWDEHAATDPDPATGEARPPGTTPSTPSAIRTSRCTWPVSATDSTPRAFWPGRGTPGPLHRLPDQVPHQARRRLSRGTDRHPACPCRAAGPSAPGTSGARRAAPTGSATASSPRTPAPAWSPAHARAGPIAASISATPGAVSWSPASGPVRRSPTTAPTARPGSWQPSADSHRPGPVRLGVVAPGHPHHMEHAVRLFHVVLDRQRCKVCQLVKRR